MRYCIVSFVVFTALTVMGNLWAGEASFTCVSASRGHIFFGNEAVELRLCFQNNGAFQGTCRECVRVADFSGNGKTPAVSDIELTADSERRHTLVLPAEKHGCFQIIYTLMQNSRIVFRRVVTCAKLSPVIPLDPAASVLGMYCHLPEWNGEKDFPVLKQMGFSWIRTDFPWHLCQPERGVWDWSKGDARMAVVRKYGMAITYNLLYSPSWAVKVRNLYGGTPADFNDFAEFAARACSRYPEVIYWSIWNEPDAESHWSGGGEAFARLLRTAVPAMRRANPQIQLLPGGVTGLTSSAEPFMREVGRHGGGDYFDVYDFHYRGLEVHKKVAADFGWKKPFWNTELSGGPGDKRHIMPRETIAGLAHGLERVFLFIWSIQIKTQDQATEFGDTRMVDNDGCPNGNFPVVYTLSSQLNGISKAEDCSQGLLCAYHLSGKMRDLWTCWKKGNPRSTLSVRTELPLRAVTVEGISHSLEPVDGRVFVPADDTIYLIGGKNIRPEESSGGATLLPLRETPVYGKLLHIQAEVRNPSARLFSGDVTLLASADWEPAVSAQKVTLAPGETKPLAFVVTPRRLCDLSESRLYLLMHEASGRLCGFDKMDVSLSAPLQFTLSPAFQWGKKKVLASVENRTSAGIPAELTFRAGATVKTVPFDASPMAVTRVYFTPDQKENSLLVEAVLSAPGGKSREKTQVTWHGLPSQDTLAGKRNIALNRRSDVVSASTILYEWSGQNDLSAEASLYWTPDWIVLEADVTDDVLREASNAGPLGTCDSLQVYFDGSVYEVGLCGGNAVCNCNGDMAVKPDYSVSRRGTVTSYRMAFPKQGGRKWSLNDTITFAFIVNDADNSQRKGWLVFRNDIGDPLKRKNTEPSTLTK